MRIRRSGISCEWAEGGCPCCTRSTGGRSCLPHVHSLGLSAWPYSHKEYGFTSTSTLRPRRTVVLFWLQTLSWTFSAPFISSPVSTYPNQATSKGALLETAKYHDLFTYRHGWLFKTHRAIICSQSESFANECEATKVSIATRPRLWLKPKSTTNTASFWADGRKSPTS